MSQNPGPTNRSMTSKVALAAALALAAGPIAAPAASSGLAWDSVTKMSMGADPSSLQPGSFAADYSAAASGGQSSVGGPFAHMIPAGFMQMMQSGMAERHYIAASKERTDQPGWAPRRPRLQRANADDAGSQEEDVSRRLTRSTELFAESLEGRQG